MEIDCDVSGLGCADAQTIDLLARLQLAARRHGCALRMCHISPALHGLLAFAGLEAALGVEPGREPEQRENAVGVEEERQLDDPAV
jgi:ABC-type transporter Mla MlaB component